MNKNPNPTMGRKMFREYMLIPTKREIFVDKIN